MEDILVIGVVMSFMELLKRFIPSFPKEAFFIPILVMAAGFNAAWVHFFGGMEMTEAISEGLKLGAAAAGVYAMGKAALGKS